MDWIKVTDRMPENYEDVLTTVKKPNGDLEVRGDVQCVRFFDDEPPFWIDGHDVIMIGNEGEVTHWLPYPKPAED